MANATRALRTSALRTASGDTGLVKHALPRTRANDLSRWRLTLVVGVLLASMFAGSIVAAVPRVAFAIEPQSDVEALEGWGPYPVETRAISVPRRDGDGVFDARLYIPLAVKSGGGGHEEGAVSAPMVAFGHGYLTGVGLYEETLQHLSSWGVAVIAPHSGGALFPDHERFAADLVDALDATAVAAADEDWPGLAVDVTARGVSGHSMGGGAAVLAAAMDPRIRTVATLAAAETRPSAIAAAASISASALFIAASDDAITPVDAHQRPMYSAKSSGPAQLRIIEGGSHCGFLDRVSGIVSLACDEAEIEVGKQLALSRALLVAWFRTELAGDASMSSVAWPEAALDGTTVESHGG